MRKEDSQTIRSQACALSLLEMFVTPFSDNWPRLRPSVWCIHDIDGALILTRRLRMWGVQDYRLLEMEFAMAPFNSYSDSMWDGVGLSMAISYLFPVNPQNPCQQPQKVVEKAGEEAGEEASEEAREEAGGEISEEAGKELSEGSSQRPTPSEEPTPCLEITSDLNSTAVHVPAHANDTTAKQETTGVDTTVAAPLVGRCYWLQLVLDNNVVNE